MAASMKKVAKIINLNIPIKNWTFQQSHLLQNGRLNHFIPRVRLIHSKPIRQFPRRLLYASTVTAAVGCGLAAYGGNLWRRLQPVVLADIGPEKPQKPQFEPIRRIKSETDNSGLKLTLYQYQTCPFCCKVRAFLDYHGFSYDVVEVNSVWRTQLKWTKYPKVPVLVVDNVGENGFTQVNDSSVIISCLETFLEDPSIPFDRIVSFYPPLESEGKGKKKVFEYPNKYFVMYGDKKIKTTPDQRKEERRWRLWVDEDLVHMLSPNIYRTPSEALAAFRYFSKVGEWEKVFSATERTVVIYVGALAMFLVGKMLKNKYKLKDDVRESLYDDLNDWVKAVGSKRKFMGGDQPNLADLNVYGALSAIEGCEAFEDAKKNTKIDKWFSRMKTQVQSHAGAHPENKKLS
ncbi:hypothetical protein CAPTEDRAFT_228714 [Capitella teleta]|uniref:Prostaglandin E synthase 2 n=1 Tax=Capitella teleta TaxID=283909 RepID=R7TLG7_CAPTE|nr:hypothetical protein CAPTEDRAFT_228714 [Capitella teleta]|eukprot:ELT91950.1 hypothetical protein CAPTEDRAFT_228714 [Capitella teleta]